MYAVCTSSLHFNFRNQSQLFSPVQIQTTIVEMFLVLYTGASNLTVTVTPSNGMTSSNATDFVSGIHVADSSTTTNQSLSSSQHDSQSLSSSNLPANRSESKEASVTSNVATSESLKNQSTPEHVAGQQDSPPKVAQQQSKKLSADKLNEIGFNDKYLGKYLLASIVQSRAQKLYIH